MKQVTKIPTDAVTISWRPGVIFTKTQGCPGFVRNVKSGELNTGKYNGWEHETENT